MIYCICWEKILQWLNSWAKHLFFHSEFVISWFVCHCYTPAQMLEWCIVSEAVAFQYFCCCIFFHRSWASKMRILLMEKLKENSQSMVIHNKIFKWPWNNNSTFELLLLIPLIKICGLHCLQILCSKFSMLKWQDRNRKWMKS